MALQPGLFLGFEFEIRSHGVSGVSAVGHPRL
jgi:hypothetical protein